MQPANVFLVGRVGWVYVKGEQSTLNILISIYIYLLDPKVMGSKLSVVYFFSFFLLWRSPRLKSIGQHGTTERRVGGKGKGSVV